MKVIFHGDDFGLTTGINEGIIRAFREGLLSSTSIVASGEAACHAMDMARKNPGLDLGIHLTLCDEAPLLPGSRLTSIASSAYRFPNRSAIAVKILTGSLDLDQAEREWQAQIETVLDAGLSVSHVDGHQFVHLFPGLWEVCLRLAGKYHIPFVRSSMADPFRPEERLARSIQWLCLKIWMLIYISRKHSCPEKRVPCIGFFQAGGRMDRGSLLHTLDRLRSSTPVVEVMSHPGLGDSHTSSKYRHWSYRWDNDMNLLLDPLLADGLASRGVEITSFRKIAEESGCPEIRWKA